MTAGRAGRVRFAIEVRPGSAAEHALVVWMRRWRRDGARRLGKIGYPLQGAFARWHLETPPAALADLRARMASAGLTADISEDAAGLPT